MGHTPADMSCTECGKGSTSSKGTPKDGCRTCNKGTYSVTSGSESCLECPINTYQPQDINPSTECIACPAGYNQDTTGESSCIDQGGLKPDACGEFIALCHYTRYYHGSCNYRYCEFF